MLWVHMLEMGERWKQILQDKINGAACLIQYFICFHISISLILTFGVRFSKPGAPQYLYITNKTYKT